MSDEKQQYEIIDIKSLEAFAKLHKICFRDREDSTRVYPPGSYVGKEIDWSWIEARVEEWNRVIKEM
ncbi:MAG: hypothetical protein QF613_08360 [Candidatus Marinimicrobia bacterium]|jgi:hypothetical protein|nr:hypothetical protein [Candidatus Neomarinimicrobiota bacterium]MDP6457625.1 hypothetical protein [Candidatus Neomarinimicrobiota bacterium]MDP6594197.1 hypothetical protein [Candidatus Neomarinimicrobiota bacterium]MDP6836956.1 hypothetical protein [Candidatus Neomarinimicrobiota bacterium]|tara:strand:- start:3935 stop:4135 length:201 start_codon:yes stop_codon:yes gene_type:complete